MNRKVDFQSDSVAFHPREKGRAPIYEIAEAAQDSNGRSDTQVPIQVADMEIKEPFWYPPGNQDRPKGHEAKDY
jgi:hypothetical protein